MFGRRHVDGFELVHGDHASQLERVFIVGFSLDVGPSPGFFVGRADESFQAQRYRQIVDPSRWPTSLHHDQIDLFALENDGQVNRIGSGREKAVLASRSIKEAAHGVEFSEIQCENLLSLYLLRVRWVMLSRVRWVEECD